MIKDTSKIAKKELDTKGITKTQKEKILKYIKEINRPVTRNEIADALGFSINAVCGRVWTLINEDKELIEEEEKVFCSVSGFKCHAVKINPIKQGRLF